ncbi:hypothetical protein LX32DRAFT_240077 [Colletotrichum zoysiae]|uniref:Uncharacterized protein n=1 Tax=Colletotrichum zoysiae TaxID=1216348 RepID=A0AAD9H3B6_9PEZI|nr:hypothetical protein LX32DRAFT_240077 [Colletotrichum zoysiae]
MGSSSSHAASPPLNRSRNLNGATGLTASRSSEEFIGTISGDRLDYRVIATLRGTVTSTDMFLSPVTMLDARVPLTITAGIEKLQAQATAMTTAAATTTATTKGPGRAQTGPTATGAEAAPTSTPNAAASRAGRNGNLAGFAGVAAVAGVVLF